MHRITAGLDGLFLKNRGYKNAMTLEPAENNIKGFLGLEYALILKGWEIAVRGGGNALQHDAFQNTFNYSFGTGAAYKGYSFQYAFGGAPETDMGLGYTHRADLIISLKQPEKK
jgi:hypothetical protein